MRMFSTGLIPNFLSTAVRHPEIERRQNHSLNDSALNLLKPPGDQINLLLFHQKGIGVYRGFH